MTEAESAIADLDAALAEVGEDVVLQRLVLSGGVQTPTSVTCRAVVRAYQPQELIAGSGIIQGDSHVILSPTEITAAAWPAPVRRGDRLIVKGLARNIEAPVPINVGGTLVRIELQVRG